MSSESAAPHSRSGGSSDCRPPMKSALPTIAVLTHSTDHFYQNRYFVRLMIPRWEAMGFRVEVLTELSPFVPADIALMHVDLSVVPDVCNRLAECYPVVLNGRVTDIRKRLFSELLLGRDEEYSGSVIVKTDWNCGGWRELRRDALESPFAPLFRHLRLEDFVCRKLEQLDARRPWRSRRRLPYGSYPVYAHRDLVPAGVWENPNLLVERFVAERQGDLYCCRHWLFFGPQEVHRRTMSRDPVVKADAQLEGIEDPVPEQLRAIRQRLGFDYGKFDYGLVDGRVILYDVNRTPGHTADVTRHAQTLEVLSEGIRHIHEGTATAP
jgi:hypothetical protein